MMPITRKLVTYALNCGHSWPSAWARDLSPNAARDGTVRSRTSRVIAMAMTPSLNVSVRLGSFIESIIGDHRAVRVYQLVAAPVPVRCHEAAHLRAPIRCGRSVAGVLHRHQYPRDQRAPVVVVERRQVVPADAAREQTTVVARKHSLLAIVVTPLGSGPERRAQVG